MKKPIIQPTDISPTPSQSELTSGLPEVVFGILQSINNCLSPEDSREGNEEQERIMKLFDDFEEEIKIVSKKIDYNYNDDNYDLRLFTSDEKLEIELNRLLEENIKLKNLYKQILGVDSGKKGKVKEGLMREYLVDLVYENLKEEELEENRRFQLDENLKHLILENPEEIGRMIKKGNCNSWDLSRNSLNEIFQDNPKEFITFIKEAGKAGIKSLNLRNSLNEIFQNNPKEFITFIKEAGNAGIKSLYLWNNKLNKIFQNNPKEFITFIKEAGNAGIKSLNLGTNKLNEIFQDNPEEVTNFIKEAGRHGIKSLDLQENNLYTIFQDKPKEFITFLREAGKSGIKSLGLSDNKLNEIFQDNPEELLTLLDIIGETDLKIINFNNNKRLSELLNENPQIKSQFELKIQELKEKGIIIIN